MSIIKHFKDEEYTDLIESLVYASKDATISYYLSIMAYQSGEEEYNRRGYRLIATVMTLDGDEYGEHISTHLLSDFYDKPSIPFLLCQMVSMSVKLDEGFLVPEFHLDWVDELELQRTSTTMEIFTSSYEDVWGEFERMDEMYEVENPKVSGASLRPALKLVVNNDAQM